jgi:hypothetical protein
MSDEKKSTLVKMMTAREPAKAGFYDEATGLWFSYQDLKDGRRTPSKPAHEE